MANQIATCPPAEHDRKVDLTTQVDALERALGRLGVRFVEEELPEEAHIDGGLCSTGGQRVLVVSPSAPPWRRAEVLLDALRRLPHEQIWLPPEIRKILQDQDFSDRRPRLVPSAVTASARRDGEENDR
ncbi:MAG: hypothetical protein AAF436_20830 [Myxococcota bacterium]